MRHIHLKSVEDWAYGEVGLLPDGVSLMSSNSTVAYNGTLLAHDIIEHQNGLAAIGSIDDELQALGAIWAIRGQWGDINRPINYGTSPITALANDILTLAEVYENGVPFRTPVPVTYAHNMDEYFEQIRDDARHSWRKWGKAELPEFWDGVVPFMRVGVRKAAKRYRGNFLLANSMFWYIADAVNPHCRPEYEGQRFLLSYDRHGATCREVTDEYYA